MTFSKHLFFIMIMALSLFTWQVSASSCPFCNPVLHADQGVLTGEYAILLVTKTPVKPGHLLVIPKRKVARFEDLSITELNEMHAMIKLAAQAFKDFYGVPDYLLIQENGKGAGTSYTHAHMHLIPSKHAETVLGQLQNKAGIKTLAQEDLNYEVKVLRRYFSSIQNEFLAFNKNNESVG